MKLKDNISKRDNTSILSSYVVDDVLVEVDLDGNEHFSILEKTTKSEELSNINDNRTWLGKLVDWWKNATVRPCIKSRDLSDPFNKLDIRDGSNHHGIEIGVEVRF